MALQVWLPLNGDLNNKGLSGVAITNRGATVDNNGKLGKCYSFGTSTSYLSIPPEAMTSFTTEASICFWINILSWNTTWATYFQAGTNGTAWSCYRFGFLRNSSGSNCAFVLGNGSSTTTTSYTTPTLELNKWYHVALIYKTGYCAIYINGNLHNEYAPTIVPAFAGITHITIGMANNKSSYQTNCLLNDFRIYNHCLSAKEIKEVSKELVLHYKLDDPYIIPTINLVPSGNYGSANNSVWGCMQTTNTVEEASGPAPFRYNNKIVMTKLDTGSGGGYGVSRANYITITGGATYIYSMYIKADDDLAYTHANFLYRREYNESNTQVLERGTFTSTSNKEYIGGGWYRIWGTFIANSESTKVTIQFFTYPNKTITYYIGGTQLELGDTLHAYTEGSYTLNKIYDCSGYNHDGSITGTLSLSENSPRYKYSTFFNGSGYIKTLPGELSWTNFEQLTIAAWMKPTVTPSNYTGSIGIGHDSSNGHKLFAISNYAGKFYLNMTNGSYVNINSGYTCPLNEWHHYAVTLNGVTLNMYVDGVVVKTTTIDFGTATVHSNPQFQVGVDLPGTDEKYTGYYSDVRIYATALSAEDILELYNTATFVDNCGNLECYEIDEKHENLFKLEYINIGSKSTITYTERNGELAIPIPANYFYYGSGDARNNALKGMFKANTQYKFDFWIDYDAIVSGGANRTGGINIYYTDGTVDYSLTGVGDATNPIGWQHKTCITAAGKTIKELGIYYYASTPAYYRWDSVITPVVEKTAVSKTGIVTTGQFRENVSVAQVCKGDHIDINQIIEI